MVDIEKCATKESDARLESIASVTVVDDHSSALPRSSLLVAGQKESDPADGGVQAWLTVFGAFMALFCTFGQLNSFGTFQSWYAEHQLRHLPPSTIAWIGSLQLWVFFFSGGFVGRFFDAYGPRVIMLPGTVVLTFSIMMTSISTQYYQYILSQGILFGLGVGMIFYPPLAAISTHFSRYRATALGIGIAGSGVGGVVYPIMFQQLFARVGFAWAVRISGFVSLSLCILAIATVTKRPSITQQCASWINVEMFKDTCFVLITIASILISLGLFIPFFYIVDYAIDHGIAPSTAFYVLAVMNAGGILGRLAPAFLSDAIGRFNTIVPCAFLAGLSVLVFWIFTKSLVSIMLFAMVYGFFSGAFNALIIPCIAQISEMREIGTRIGVLYSIISFPSLCGGPAAGALLKLGNGSYTGMIMLSGISVIAGSFFLLWARITINTRALACV
ncbi:Riboflavin transporter MCH5 [Grifola frondosa]|uniref:Riboflavin transporter MCH5 n=1 Tax=Grifola frondosa TaxID=5627 RepID=A0A1C7LSK4_GRIFR|nr:Riboflavin transporter MCH5 [Grifola frondosa]